MYPIEKVATIASPQTRQILTQRGIADCLPIGFREAKELGPVQKDPACVQIGAFGLPGAPVGIDRADGTVVCFSPWSDTGSSVVNTTLQGIGLCSSNERFLRAQDAELVPLGSASTVHDSVPVCPMSTRRAPSARILSTSASRPSGPGVRSRCRRFFTALLSVTGMKQIPTEAVLSAPMTTSRSRSDRIFQFRQDECGVGMVVVTRSGMR
jgi:hypothetical protein